jgi:two-component system NtrC family sensor kinase
LWRYCEGLAGLFKKRSSGIGLGLAIVHGIVQSHNGKVEAHSELGKGTCISIYFPTVKKIRIKQH